jgi:hypothetical protein
MSEDTKQGMGWEDVLEVVSDVLPGDSFDGHAGGTVMVRSYLPDGRNVIVTVGDDDGEPFSGDQVAQTLFLGLYPSTEHADNGGMYVAHLPKVPATVEALTEALYDLTGLLRPNAAPEGANQMHVTADRFNWPTFTVGQLRSVLAGFGDDVAITAYVDDDYANVPVITCQGADEGHPVLVLEIVKDFDTRQW